MKKKTLIISTFCLLSISTLTYLLFLRPSKMIILEHLTSNKEQTIEQICLVKNPPLNSSKMKTMLDDFNESHPVKNSTVIRLFIKENQRDFLSFLFWQDEKLDYESPKITTVDLDNADYLGYSTTTYFANKIKETKSEVYQGELWHY